MTERERYSEFCQRCGKTGTDETDIFFRHRQRLIFSRVTCEKKAVCSVSPRFFNKSDPYSDAQFQLEFNSPVSTRVDSASARYQCDDCPNTGELKLPTGNARFG